MGDEMFYYDQYTYDEEENYMDEFLSAGAEDYGPEADMEEIEPKPPDYTPYSLNQQEERVAGRGEQNSEQPGDTRSSTWSKLHKTPYNSNSVIHFNPYYQPASKIPFSAFTGKRSYLEWEENMDEWFHYNQIREEKRLVYAIEQLSGEAYKWWVQEKVERRRYKEPTITTWRMLKELLRKRYAPKRRNKEHNTTHPRKKVISASNRCDKSVRKATTNGKVLSKNDEQLVKAIMARMEQVMDERIDAFRQKLQHHSGQKHNKSEQICSPEELPTQDSEQSKSIRSESGKDQLNGGLNIQQELVENKMEQTLTAAQKQCSDIERIETSGAEHAKDENIDSTPRETILIVQSSPHVLLDTKISKTHDLIQYWQHYMTGHSFKYSCFNVSISSIMHLFFPMSFQKQTGAEGVLFDMRIKGKPPDWQKIQNILQELKQGIMRQMGECTGTNAELNHTPERKLLSLIQYKENPPDKGLQTPRLWIYEPTTGRETSWKRTRRIQR